MKKWLILTAGLVILVGAAVASRQAGIDLVSWASLQSGQGTSRPQATQGGQEGRSSGQRRGPLPVEIAKVVTAELSNDIGAIGTLLAAESVEISPETNGRVNAILFKDGDQIAANQPLFRLDEELTAADLSEARARLSLAEANFKRTETLRRSGNTAQSVYDAAETELQVARAAAESAEVRLSKLTILAPFAGIAGFRTVSTGAYVTAGTALVKLDKVDVLKVNFSLPELVQSRIVLGQTVELSADALPDERFTANVSAIDPVIDVNGRALQVRADLDNAALRLKPGMLVRVIVKGAPRRAVMVPETAVIQRGQGTFVFVAQDAKAEEKEVRTGKREGGLIEILGGIDAGTEVVVAGGTRLNNGAAIEVVEVPAVD